MGKDTFRIPEDQIRDLTTYKGFGIVSNRITVDGMKVGFMYREEGFDKEDTGWRFLSGDETEDYLDDPETSKALSINTIANYDAAILSYIRMPVGTELERLEGTDEFAAISDREE